MKNWSDKKILANARLGSSIWPGFLFVNGAQDKIEMA
jgi:hypothetical protein